MEEEKGEEEMGGPAGSAPFGAVQVAESSIAPEDRVQPQEDFGNLVHPANRTTRSLFQQTAAPLRTQHCCSSSLPGAPRCSRPPCCRPFLALPPTPPRNLISLQLKQGGWAYL